MPTLLIADDGFSDFQRLVYRRVFFHACEVLDIQSYDASVTLRQSEMPMKRPHLIAAITTLEPDHYLIVLKYQAPPARGMFGMCHEIIHLKQHLIGSLRNLDDGAMWHDQFFTLDQCENPFMYHSLPWEQEAHAMQDRVYSDVVRRLISDEIVLAGAKP